MSQFINTDNLVEFHRELDTFAKHHYKRGVEDSLAAIRNIKQEAEKIKLNHKSEIAFKTGYISALQRVIKELEEILNKTA